MNAVFFSYLPAQAPGARAEQAAQPLVHLRALLLSQHSSSVDEYLISTAWPRRLGASGLADALVARWIYGANRQALPALAGLAFPKIPFVTSCAAACWRAALLVSSVQPLLFDRAVQEASRLPVS